jgi:hypothetical protein
MIFMADITNELQTIATAVYGSEMRTAIHDAIEKVNNDTTAPTISAGTYEGNICNVTYLFEKTGDIVDFNLNIAITTTPPTAKEKIMDIPEGFEFGYDAGTKRVFTLSPCPYDTSGTNEPPYITIEKVSGVYSVYIYNGNQFGWVSKFVTSGVYSTAEILA